MTNSITGAGGAAGGLRQLSRTVAKLTLEGLSATGDAVRAMAREPELAAYLSAWAVNVTCSAAGWHKPRAVSKVALMPLLAANVVRHRRRIGTDGTATLLAGLAGGWVGDIVLLPIDPPLNKGAIAFTLNHLAYHRLMWRAGARPSPLAVGLRAPLLAVAGATTMKDAPQLLPSSLTYGPVLAATGVLGQDRILVDGAARPAADAATGVPVGDARYGISHGGNVFLLSDLLLVASVMYAKPGSLPNRLLNAGVMDTYCLAQLLLIRGLAEVAARGAGARDAARP